jgi:acyl-homoserine lactone acylase PvdQ
MLLFRSEEHVERWLKKWNPPRGEVFSPEQCYQLGKAWYSPDRREPDWRRYTADEAEAIFRKIGLSSDFWCMKE